METSTLSRFITETVFTTKTIPAAVLTALSEKNGKPLTTELFQDLISQDYTLLEKLQSVPEKYDKKSAQDVVDMFVATSATRRVLQGVYHDVANKKLVATNGNYLAYCDMIDEEKESLIIDKAGNTIEGVFPNYQAVIPTKFTFATEINNIDFYAGYLKSINNLSGWVKLREVYATLKGVLFRTDLLYTVFSAFVKIGAKSITMHHAIKDTSSMLAPVVFESAGLTVVLMPALKKGNYINLENCKPSISLHHIEVGFSKITGIPGHVLEDFSPRMTEYRINTLRHDIKSHLVDAINGAFFCITDFNKKPDTKKIDSAFRAMITSYDSDTMELLRDIKRIVTKIKTREEAINNLSAFLKFYAKLIAHYNKLYGHEQVTFLKAEEIKSTILKTMRENRISQDDIAAIESINII